MRSMGRIVILILSIFVSAWVSAEKGRERNFQPLVADDCPARFPESERNKWHSLSGGRYYIDSAGRPRTAYKLLPPINKASRSQSCQSKTNDLGGPGPFDAGHMIAASLGGWGKRANLVPQVPGFNQQNWRYMEAQVALCIGLPDQSIRYEVRVSYPNNQTDLPSHFTMDITIDQDNITRTFQNAEEGGPKGGIFKNEVIDWLIEKGCS